MIKLEGKMFTAKELIDNMNYLEKLNNKYYRGLFFEQISIETETMYINEIQRFDYFPIDCMTAPCSIREGHVIKILLYDMYHREQRLIQMNIDEVLIFLQEGRYIVLNKNDIEQEKVLEIE